jgi:hypothetical protein
LPPWPAFRRPSTTCLSVWSKDVNGRDKLGHDDLTRPASNMAMSVAA